MSISPAARRYRLNPSRLRPTGLCETNAIARQSHRRLPDATARRAQSLYALRRWRLVARNPDVPVRPQEKRISHRFLRNEPAIKSRSTPLKGDRRIAPRPQRCCGTSRRKRRQASRQRVGAGLWVALHVLLDRSKGPLTEIVPAKFGLGDYGPRLAMVVQWARPRQQWSGS
jgi:hypothetical protein